MYKYKICTPKLASIPVISIGNIDFGGSGKTPLAMHLLSRLQKAGFRPALISRGYRGKWEHRQEILSDGKKIFGSWKDSGDEPFMIAQNCPAAGVLIGKNRVISVGTAANMGFDIAVLDDGFQHRKLYRDIDIVLYDPGEKIMLRESESALKRCNIVLIKEKQKGRIQDLEEKFPQAGFFPYKVVSAGIYSIHQNESVSKEKLLNKKILGICGIARPQRFREQLKILELRPTEWLRFPDHFPYPPHSIKKILAQYHRIKADAIITTEKDKAKLMETKEFRSIPVYYLKIDLEIGPEFYDNIWSLLTQKEAQR